MCRFRRPSGRYRINLITPISDNFSQQRLDPEKQFQSFAFGIVSSFLSSEQSNVHLSALISCYSSNMLMI